MYVKDQQTVTDDIETVSFNRIRLIKIFICSFY